MRTVIVLLIGVAAGLLLARVLQPPPPPAAATPAVAPAPKRQPVREIAPAIVTLQAFRRGQLLTSVPAVVVVDNSTLLAPIDGFAGTHRLVATTAGGRQVEVPVVLAGDEQIGLAILGTRQPVTQTRVLQPAADNGSLYIGRELQLLTGNKPYAASVSAAGVRDELGVYNFRIDIRTFTDSGLATAIVRPGTDELLGFIRGNHSATTAVALDIGPIKTLLARAGREPEMTPGEYSAHYYQRTSVGRIARLRELVAAADYRRALDAGRAALHLDDYTLRHGRPLMLIAYRGAAGERLQKGDWGATLALLDEADGLVGMDDDLRLLRAETRQAIGDLRGALDDLLALSDPEPHKVRMLVIENALAAGQDGGTSLALLQRALDSDPGYAPYHRLLGEMLAKRGDMRGAVAALEQALLLDATLAAEINPLLDRLRARRNTPPLTEVPIQRRRNTLYVNARINGSNETYRFLFDTGASYTAITTETALRLGINDIFFGAPVVALETANGRIYTTTATLRSIDINGARVDNVDAVILESMSGVDGLLGQSFLRHFDISIDRSRGVIAFSRRLGE